MGWDELIERFINVPFLFCTLEFFEGFEASNLVPPTFLRFFVLYSGLSANFDRYPRLCWDFRDFWHRTIDPSKIYGTFAHVPSTFSRFSVRSLDSLGIYRTFGSVPSTFSRFSGLLALYLRLSRDFWPVFLIQLRFTGLLACTFDIFKVRHPLLSIPSHFWPVPSILDIVSVPFFAFTPNP